MSVELSGLEIGDPPEPWAALGFDVVDEHMDLGGVRVRLGAAAKGIVSWTLHGVEATDIDGLVTRSTTTRELGPNAPHTNGALAVDHVVVVSPDFDRTSSALAAAGMPLRRIRDAGGFRQGFRRLGPAILELVEARDAPGGPAAFWGLVVTVSDLDALARDLGDRLGTIRDAVQPERRIATVRAAAGIGPALAFMDPEP
jgi:hypothetical protein